MDALLEFMWKSTGVLLLFVIVYQLLLKRLTFFNANRWFLLAGLLASIVFPFVEITQTVYVEASQQVLTPQQAATPTAFILQQPLEIPVVTQEPAVDLGLLALYGYMIVALFFLGKMTVELASLIKLISNGARVKRDGFVFVTLSRKLTPFSFFNYICYSVQEKDSEELALIIDHEKVHARQWHSVDLLLSHVYRAFFWWNPLAWIVKTQIGENLEFIADSHAKSRHAHGHTYERALLSRAASHMQPALANNFFTPFIKQRIVMLQKEASATWNAYKYALILPVMLVFIYSFNRVQEIEYVEKETAVTLPREKEMTLADVVKMIEIENVEIKQEDLTYDITAVTTAAQLAVYEKEINAYANYEMRFKDVKSNDSGRITSFLIGTKVPSQKWNNHATVAVTPNSLWLLVATKEELKLNQENSQQSIIMSIDGTKLVKEDLTYGNDENDSDPFMFIRKTINLPTYTIVKDSLVSQNNGIATIVLPSVNDMMSGKKAIVISGTSHSIEVGMNKIEVEEIIGKINAETQMKLRLSTLKYKKGKISKIKLRANKDGNEQVVASESSNGINTICMQVSKEQVLFVKCDEARITARVTDVRYVNSDTDSKDKNSGHLYYKNGTYSYVSENGETKIFNSWGVQVHSMDFIISSGRAANGKTTINNKPYAFTVDKNGALEFKDTKNNIVIENLLTAYETFEKSQNIVLPASGNKNLVYGGNSKALYVIDDKIQDIKTGKPKYLEADVMTVNVLKGNDAINKYGDAGKNGVVEITTKGLQKQLQNEVNANQATSKNLKDFKIVFEKSARGIQMRSLQGTAWIDLSFSLENNKPQAINEYGMTTLQKGTSYKDAALANFLFTITKTENGITLKGIEGTVWTGLSFSLTKNSKQVVNQYGVTTID
jgi:hypothetical protein